MVINLDESGPDTADTVGALEAGDGWGPDLDLVPDMESTRLLLPKCLVKSEIYYVSAIFCQVSKVVGGYRTTSDLGLLTFGNID